MLGDATGHISIREMWNLPDDALERRVSNAKDGLTYCAPNLVTWYENRIDSLERELARRAAARSKNQTLSLATLHSRIVHLTMLQDEHPLDSRAWWIKEYENELERRTNHQLGMPWNRISDEDLDLWEKYYQRKIDTTDDPSWNRRWRGRLVRVQSQKDFRRQAKGRVYRPNPIGPGYVESPYITHAHLVSAGDTIHGTPVYDGDIEDPNRKLIGFVNGTSIEKGDLIATVSGDFTKKLDDYFYKEFSMHIDYASLAYPLTRSLLRNNRYTVLFHGSNVELTAGTGNFDLDKLSDELVQLDVIHRIEVVGSGRKTLKADLSSDAFKRLLGKLL